MPDPTIADDSQAPTKDQIYDMLMAEIEPELTSTQLPLLAEKYKDEMPEAGQARAARYEKAFAEFDKQFAAFAANLEAKAHAYQSTARQSLEHEEREKEDVALGGLEQQMKNI